MKSPLYIRTPERVQVLNMIDMLNEMRVAPFTMLHEKGIIWDAILKLSELEELLKADIYRG